MPETTDRTADLDPPDGPGTVYLLHFDRPYVHAKHYLGWASPGHLTSRLADHAAGRGARLMEVIASAGIGFHLARTWTGTRTRERQLKNQGGASRCCPDCGVQPRTPRTTRAKETTMNEQPAAQPADESGPELSPAQLEDLRCWLADSTGLTGDDPDWYLDPANATDQQVLDQVAAMTDTGDDQARPDQYAATGQARDWLHSQALDYFDVLTGRHATTGQDTDQDGDQDGDQAGWEL